MTSGLVSVVIPCRNEVRAIEGTVKAILNSDYPQIEILVVDGMSEDGTREVLSRLQQEDARVRMIDNPKKLTPFAFNLGVKNAKGEFVQIVGSRNVMARDYIALLVNALMTRPEVSCVGGDYQHVADTKMGRWISLAMESKFGVGAGNYRTMSGDAYVDTVGVPMYRSSIFGEVGYFDEALTRNQDDDFNFRLTKMGRKILYVHAAKVTYLVRGSLRKAFHQFSQYGYFKVFVNKKHGAITTLRQLVPAGFLAFLVLAGVGATFSFIFVLLTLAIFLLYTGLGLVMSGKKLSIADRVMTVVSCFVLHLGYGYGYWMGIFDFLVVRRTPRLRFQGQTT